MVFLSRFWLILFLSLVASSNGGAIEGLDVDADQIEYSEKEATFTALGNAIAKQQGKIIKAPKLVAFLEKKPQGSVTPSNTELSSNQDSLKANSQASGSPTQEQTKQPLQKSEEIDAQSVRKIEAPQSVVVETQGTTIKGSSATYFVSEEHALFRGKTEIFTPQYVISSQKQADFFAKENKATLEGAVLIEKNQDHLHADFVTVYFQKQKSQNKEESPSSSISKAIASGNVIASTSREQARADEATYVASEDKIFLKGNVQLMQGANFLKGNSGVVDLKNKTSFVHSVDDALQGSARQRVKILLYPRKLNQKT